jgi:hypothetical protein
MLAQIRLGRPLVVGGNVALLEQLRGGLELLPHGHLIGVRATRRQARLRSTTQPQPNQSRGLFFDRMICCRASLPWICRLLTLGRSRDFGLRTAARSHERVQWLW